MIDIICALVGLIGIYTFELIPPGMLRVCYLSISCFCMSYICTKAGIIFVKDFKREDDRLKEEIARLETEIQEIEDRIAGEKDSV